MNASTGKRGYHHGNLRSALVEAAVELAREGGPDAVVLREMARVVGVSHNAAYRHFADRDEVLAAVADQATSSLEASMRASVEAVVEGDPPARARARLRAVGRDYVTFALANPGLFRVAFAAPDEPPSGSAAAEPVHEGGPYAVLNAVLDEMVEARAMPPERRAYADVTCWAAVHGLSNLFLDGPLAAVPEAERAEIVEHALETVERGLGAG